MFLFFCFGVNYAKDDATGSNRSHRYPFLSIEVHNRMIEAVTGVAGTRTDGKMSDSSQSQSIPLADCMGLRLIDEKAACDERLRAAGLPDNLWLSSFSPEKLQLIREATCNWLEQKEGGSHHPNVSVVKASNLGPQYHHRSI